MALLINFSYFAAVNLFFLFVQLSIRFSYFCSCQFVVREGENYEVHLQDADTLVDWNLIEQVVLKTTADVPSCPIW